MMQQDEQEHQRRAERIETLLESIAALQDEQTRTTVLELVQLLLDIYGDGLARILEIITQTDAHGQVLIKQLAQDELIGSLLILHELHPLALDERILQALDEVRPRLRALGSEVEYFGVNNGVAEVKLVHIAGHNGKHAVEVAVLQSTLKEALNRSVPDLNDVNIQGLQDFPRRPDIPLARVQTRAQQNKARS